MNENAKSAQIKMNCYRNKSLLRVLLLLSAVALAFSGDFKPTQDYCAASLCKNHQHVACKVQGEYGDECEIDAEFVTMTNSLKDAILKNFNEFRNTVARGFDALFPAARMATLTWCDELAYLAKLNVRQCKLHADQCRNTAVHKNVGQTVAYRGTKSDATVRQNIEKMIALWLKELDSVTMIDIIKHLDNHGMPKKNVLQIVLENANQVGCGALQQFKDGWTQTFFTCNYANAPIVGKPIFTTSKNPAANCTKIHPTYTNLCDDEKPSETAAVNSAIIPGKYKKTNVTEIIETQIAPNMNSTNNETDEDAENVPNIHKFDKFRALVKKAARLAKSHKVMIITSNYQIHVNGSTEKSLKQTI